MTLTLSGHVAITSPTSVLLGVAKVPGRPITLRTGKTFLPLFLRLAVLCDQVIQLHPNDTWSYAYRAPRMGDGISDHAGWAVDFWSSREGAATWPSRMSSAEAEDIAHILEHFTTASGEHIFGWGAVKAGGYTGPHYTKTRYNDPMHFYRAPGVSNADGAAVIKRLRIRPNGTIAP